jgi:hypothetical protein
MRDVFWVATTLLLSGLGFTVGRGLGVKPRFVWLDQARSIWQVEAESELPEPDQACRWVCRGAVSADLLQSWQVEALELSSALPLSGGKKLPTRRIEGDDLEQLNQLGRIAAAWHRSDPDGDHRRLREFLEPVVEVLVRNVLSWKTQTPPSIRLDVYLGSPISVEYTLHHCRNKPGRKGEREWKEWFQWEREVHRPGGECVGIIRGPKAGEKRYAARVRKELEDCLIELVSVVRFRP